jgi:uncharacterized membrane protein
MHSPVRLFANAASQCPPLFHRARQTGLHQRPYGWDAKPEDARTSRDHPPNLGLVEMFLYRRCSFQPLKELHVNAIRTISFSVALGFLGMFIAHIVIITGFILGIRIPIYFVAYPIVYSLLGLLQTWSHPQRWISSSIFVHLLPWLFWYVLLWRDGRMNLEAAMNFSDSSQMIVILPLSLALTCLSTFILSRYRRSEKVHSTSVSEM